MSAPILGDWRTLNRVALYIKGQRNVVQEITVARDKENLAEVYCGSDLALDEVERKGTMGVVVQWVCACVTSCSRIQATAATSSTDAECCVLRAGAAERLGLNALLIDRDMKPEAIQLLSYRHSAGAISAQPRVGPASTRNSWMCGIGSCRTW